MFNIWFCFIDRSVTEEETVLEQRETVPEEANIHYCHLHLEIR